MAFCAGAEFLSYDEFEAGLKSYSAFDKCLFVKRSSEAIKDGSLACVGVGWAACTRVAVCACRGGGTSGPGVERRIRVGIFSPGN